MTTAVNENQSYVPRALAGAGLLGTAGWLGGKSLELITPAVIPFAHALALGLTAPASMAMYALANKVNEDGGFLNTLFSLVAGYTASVGIANLLGYSVSFTAPFAGLTALTVLSGIVATVTIPIIVVAGICISCTLPAAPQNGERGLAYVAARFFPLAPERNLAAVGQL